MIDRLFVSGESELCSSSSSSSSDSAVRPSEARDGSGSPSASESVDDRMNVAETEVISRTKRESRGVQGRIECHSDGVVASTEFLSGDMMARCLQSSVQSHQSRVMLLETF